MKSLVKKMSAAALLAVMVCTFAFAAFSVSVSAADDDETEAVVTEEAAEEEESDENSLLISKAYAAAATIIVVAAAGAIGMALTISKAEDGVARQPEASGKIQTMLMLGLVFIETAIIYALIIAILIIFVL